MKWDVSRVNNMADMFWGANLFNGDISKWDVSSATDMKASKMDMVARTG